MTAADPNAKRHKHKHKCGDELCKHRKHKKRRKHKKHHHRADQVNDVFETSGVLAEAVDEAHEIECNDLAVVKAVETPKAVPKTSDDKKRNLTKAVNVTLNKLQWPLDEDLISSITEESSGSSYVSFDLI